MISIVPWEASIDLRLEVFKNLGSTFMEVWFKYIQESIIPEKLTCHHFTKFLSQWVNVISRMSLWSIENSLCDVTMLLPNQV